MLKRLPLFGLEATAFTALDRVHSAHVRGLPAVVLVVCCIGVVPCVEAQTSSGAALPNLVLGFSTPAALWPRMTDSEKRGTADGAAIGAIAGAFISAYPAMSDGAAGGAGGNSLPG